MLNILQLIIYLILSLLGYQETCVGDKKVQFIVMLVSLPKIKKVYNFSDYYSPNSSCSKFFFIILTTYQLIDHLKYLWFR